MPEETDKLPPVAVAKAAVGGAEEPHPNRDNNAGLLGSPFSTLSSVSAAFTSGHHVKESRAEEQRSNSKESLAETEGRALKAERRASQAECNIFCLSAPSLLNSFTSAQKNAALVEAQSM